MKKTLIILASYNGEAYILQQIESILSQEVVDLDIIVFDDHSTDDTVSILNEFCKTHHNITLIVNKEQSGSAAKNFCNSIKQIPEKRISKYDYIALSDQDDIWLPNKLLSAIDKLSKSKASLYASNLTIWDEKTNKKSLLKKDYPQKKFDFLFEGGSAGCTYVFTSNFAVDFRNKLFDIDYENWNYFSHDWLIYFFARVIGAKVMIDNLAAIDYRIHRANVHGQMNTNSFTALKKRFNFVLNGWYIEQIKGFKQLLMSDSKEIRIYNLYVSNWFSRLWVLLRYNFSLMRSKRKFFEFALISLIPIKSKAE